MISKLWNGGYGLTVTFWLFGIMGGVITLVISGALAAAGIDTTAFRLVAIAYLYIVYTGTRNVNPPSFWRLCASFAMIALLLLQLAFLFLSYIHKAVYDMGVIQ